MQSNIIDLLDFERINVLLEGFNKTTGFVTAILDLDGNVLSKSGWRQICTEFHRVHPETAKKCKISDTELAGKLAEGEKYNYYKCLNGLVDVAVPIIIKGEHIANLFSGQFFFEKPNRKFFVEQAINYNFDNAKYLDALDKVPVVSEEKVKIAMSFLLEMTQLITEMTIQKLEQDKLNEALKNSEARFRTIIDQAGDAMYLCNFEGEIRMVNNYSCEMLGYSNSEFLKMRIGDLDVNYIDLKLQKEIWNKLLLTKPQTLITTHKHKDGLHIPVEIRYSLVEFDGYKAILGFVRNITERKKNENDLQLSEAKFRGIYEQSPIAIEIFDVDGNMIDVNQHALDLFGIDDKNHIIGFNLWKDPHLSTENVSVLENGRPVFISTHYDFEAVKTKNIYPTSRSGIMYIDMHVMPFMEKNEVIGYLVQIIEVTEQKLMLEELKNRNEYIESIMENMPIGFALNIIDDGSVKYMNNRFEEIYGWSRDVLTNTSIFFDNVFSDQEYREKVTSQIIADMQSGDPERMCWKDLKIVTNTGKERFVTAFNIPLIDQNLMISTVQDTTKRKQAEDELKESKENLQNTFDISPSIICKAKIDTGYFVEANQAVSKILGYSVEEFIAKPLMEFIHPDDRKKTADAFFELLKGMEVTSFENRYFCLDGSYKWMVWNVSKADKNGIVTAIASDISERKLVEKEIVKHREHLEELVEERTVELKNKYLELERLNKLFVDRELRMIELKQKIKELENRQSI